MNVHNPALSLRACAEIADRATATLRGAISRGELPSHMVEVKAQHRYERRVYRSDLLSWMQRSRRHASPAPKQIVCRRKLQQAISEAMQRWELSPTEAEDAIGLNAGHLSKIQRCLEQGRLPRTDTFCKILLWLDAPLEDLKADD